MFRYFEQGDVPGGRVLSKSIRFNGVCRVMGMGMAVKKSFRFILGAAVLSTGRLSSLHAQAPYLIPYTITTAAGGGTAPTIGATCTGANGTTATAEDIFGDGCLASSSSVVTNTDIHDVGLDPIGNIYFLDTGTYSVLRRIDARSGIVNVLAGTFSTTSTGTKVCAASTDAYGDGCPANDGKGNVSGANTANIGKSRGIGVAKNGDVYIADYGISLVHKISASTGLMTVAAGYISGGTVTAPTGNKGTAGYTGDGGPATSAEVRSPRGIAIDASNNLYIADSGNNVIRMVSAATNVITTIVGTYPGTNAAATAGAIGDLGPAKSAQLSTPEDIEVDANGNLFIGDFGNNKVRVVYAGGAAVAKLIALTNNGAVATAGYIYTVVGGNTTLFTPNTPALATSVAISQPRKIALDGRGNIYIADNGYDVIWFVDITTGYIRILAGTTSKVSGASCTGQTDTVGDGCAATQATLNPNSAMGVGVGPLGDVYISDSLDTRLRHVSLNNTFPATAAGSTVTQTMIVHYAAGDSMAAAAGFTVTGSTDYVLTGAPACVSNADTTSDCTITVTFTPTRPGPDYATLVVATTAGLTSQIGLNGNGTASSVALDPGTTTVIGTGLSTPAGITQDSAGNTYIADTGNNRVMKYNAAGTGAAIAGTGTSGYSGDGAAATASKLAGPKAVAVAPDGTVYIADTGNSVIRRVDPVTGFISTFGGAGTSTCPMTIDTLGDGCPATSAKFSAPAGLTTDNVGNLYVSDTGNNLIREISPTGYVFLTAGGATTVCGSDIVGNGCLATQAILKAPTALQLDANKNLYIADTGNNEVRKLVAASNLFAVVAGTGSPGGSGNGGIATGAQVNAPTGVSVDAAGNVYIADTGNHAVRVVNATGTINSVAGTLGANGTGTLPGVATSILFNLPGGVFATGTGALYVADSGNSRAVSINRGAVSLNFGRTNVSTSSPSTAITETSTGSATASLGYPLFVTSGTPAVFSLTAAGTTGCSSSSSTPQSLAPGASCGLTAQFNPVAVGSFTATYTESNATTVNSPAPSIALVGAGAILTKTSLTTAVTTPATGSPQYSISFVVTSTIKPAVCDPTAPNCAVGGTVTFFVDGTQVGLPVIVSNTGTTATNVATASQTINGQSVGTHTVVAVYSGDTYYASSTATSLAISVTQGATTTTVTPNAASLSQFSALNLTAVVKSATSNVPTGTVAFYAGTVLLGTSGVNPLTGIATLSDTTAPTTLGLVAGTYSITGVYSGDANYAKSTSAATSVVVNPDAQGFTIALSSGAAGTAQGSTALTQVYVTPSNTLNGTVTFACSNMPTNSVCTISPTTLVFTPIATAGIQQSAALTLWTDVNPNVLPTSSSAHPLDLFRHPGTTLATLLGWPVLFAGLAGVFGFRRKFRRTSLLTVLALIALLTGSTMVLTGCNSSQFAATVTPAGTYKITLTVSGPSSTVQTMPITFTVAPGVAGQL